MKKRNKKNATRRPASRTATARRGRTSRPPRRDADGRAMRIDDRRDRTSRRRVDDGRTTEAAPACCREAARPDDWDGPTHEAAAVRDGGAGGGVGRRPSGEVDAEAELPASPTPGPPRERAREPAVRERSPADRSSDLKRLVGERDGGKVTAALEALRARRGRTAAASRWSRSRAGGTCARTPTTSAWVSRLVAGQAAAADARDAGDAVDRRLPAADHAPRDRRHPRRRLRPGAEDAARSRPGPHDRQEGGGRAADPLRHDARVPAHLQPEGSRASCRRCASSTSWARPRWRRSTPSAAAARRRRRPRDGRRPTSRRRRGPRRELDPEEDDELLTELERAAAAAAKAADATERPPTAPQRRRRRDAARRRATE